MRARLRQAKRVKKRRRLRQVANQNKSGPQPGFIVVLEQIPATGKFDKEAREQLLDIFRDAADYWADRKIPFRCFYSFL